MSEFNELLGIGLDSRGKRFATEMGGTMKFRFDKPKPKPNVWDTPEFKAKNKAIGRKAAEDSPVYLEAVRAMKNMKYVEAHAGIDLIEGMRERGWKEDDIGLFFHNQRKIARRVTADRKKKTKLKAEKGPSSPSSALDDMFKHPKTKSQGPQYNPKPRVQHFDSKKKAAS